MTTTLQMPVPISFEFFPPKTPGRQREAADGGAELAAAQPEFFTVTYGAGGSTRDKTLATVARHRRARPRRRAAPVLHRRDPGGHRRDPRHLPAAGHPPPRRAARRPAERHRDRGRVPLRQRAGRLHPREDRAATSTSRSPPTPSTIRRQRYAQARPAALRGQGQGRRRLGDHAVLLQPRRLLPLRRRGPRARRRGADRARHHADPQLRQDRPVRRPRRHRDPALGGAEDGGLPATTPPRSAPSASTSSSACASAWSRAARRGCTSTR